MNNNIVEKLWKSSAELSTINESYLRENIEDAAVIIETMNERVNCLEKELKNSQEYIKELQDLLNNIIELDAELPTSPWAPEDVVWSTSKEKIWTAHWDATMIKARLISKNIPLIEMFKETDFE